MSDPILPLPPVAEGTTQIDIEVNDGWLRLEALSREVIGVANSPSVTDDGTVYIVGSTPTGAFSTFEEDDLTIYRGGTWYAWAPVTGIVVNQAGTLKAWDGSWGDIGGGGSSSYSIVTEASPFTADPGTHDGLFRYIRAAGDVTFDDAEPYTAGMAFNIRATGSIELLEDGVTLTPPAGGTLELTSGMAVQVVMTGATAGDVIGQTVPA